MVLLSSLQYFICDTTNSSILQSILSRWLLSNEAPLFLQVAQPKRLEYKQTLSRTGYST